MKRFFIFASALCVLLANASLKGQVAQFDFQGSWTGSKEADFSVFRELAPSVDTDASSAVSLLSNNGFTAGAFASFPLQNDLFLTSATPRDGLNVGGANQTTPTNYISFTVTPSPGTSVSYTSMTLYSDTNAANDKYSVQLRVVDGAGAEQVLATHTHQTGPVNNEPVHLVNFDFPDFDSSEVTEWRIYAYDTLGASNGVRFDDITLNGTSQVNPTHFRVYFIGGQSNATGRADAAQLTAPLDSPQADVAFYFRTTLAAGNLGNLLEDAWINLAPGSGHGQTSPVNPIEFGSELSFGHAMAEALPMTNVAIVKYAHGGSNLNSDWAPGGIRYVTFLQTVEDALDALTQAGHTYELGGMVWHQGEADTNNATNSLAYEERLVSLINRVRNEAFGGLYIPFIVASLSDSQFSDINTPGNNRYNVRQAQEAVAANERQVGFVNTDGFGVRPTDTIHLNDAGQIALGQGFASEMLALESLDPDQDGVLAAEEATLGTDPNDPDSDGDGLIEAFELLLGTDPADSGSVFALSDISIDATEVSFSWPSRPGNEYLVEFSTDLVSWTTVVLGVEAVSTGSATILVNPLPTTGGPIIAHYDAEVGANGNFNTTAFDSVDTDLGTTASRLFQGGSLNGGGANNLVLSSTLFNPSPSGSPGFNFGDATTASQATAASEGDFFAFTTFDNDGGSITYEEFSFYTNQFLTAARVDVSYTVAGSETFILQNFTPTPGNVPVTLETIDFPDFTSAEEVTWSFYIYAAALSIHGIRFDDLILRGQSEIGLLSPGFYRVTLVL